MFSPGWTGSGSFSQWESIPTHLRGQEDVKTHSPAYCQINLPKFPFANCRACQHGLSANGRRSCQLGVSNGVTRTLNGAILNLCHRWLCGDKVFFVGQNHWMTAYIADKQELWGKGRSGVTRTRRLARQLSFHGERRHRRFWVSGRRSSNPPLILLAAKATPVVKGR